MRVDDADIDCVLAQLDFHQIDIGPHVTAHVAGHAASAHAAHAMQTNTHERNLAGSNRLHDDASNGNTTTEPEATTATISINARHTGIVCNTMSGICVCFL